LEDFISVSGQRLESVVNQQTRMDIEVETWSRDAANQGFVDAYQDRIGTKDKNPLPLPRAIVYNASYRR
jgi:hypothetical protein